jgi:MOSC domain-containing protein YiiM
VSFVSADAGAVRVLSVNTGRVAPLVIDGRRFTTAMGKRPVNGPVTVGPLGLAGDEQADDSVHGGLRKALYALPVAHLDYWQSRRATPQGLFNNTFLPGQLGDNLTLEGVDERHAFVDDEWHFPDCVLRVTEPRQPCYKFNATIGHAQAARDMVLSGFSGFYLAVLQTGTLTAGDTARVIPGPRSMSMAQALHAKRLKHLR